jgi:hypothetical protein
MAHTVIVRYTTRSDRADENEQLIREVFAELAVSRPPGLDYAAFRLEDGVSFVHLATIEGDENPLTSLPAFQSFVAGIGDRCIEPPVSTGGSPVGRYRGGS